LNDYGLVTFHYSYAGVGSTQINAYNFSHVYVGFVCFLFERQSTLFKGYAILPFRLFGVSLS